MDRPGPWAAGGAAGAPPRPLLLARRAWLPGDGRALCRWLVRARHRDPPRPYSGNGVPPVPPLPVRGPRRRRRAPPGPPPDLERRRSVEAELRELLGQERTWTSGQLVEALAERGIRLSERQVRRYLRRLDAGWRRTKRTLVPLANRRTRASWLSPT